jgi:plastocyanin
VVKKRKNQPSRFLFFIFALTIASILIGFGLMKAATPKNHIVYLTKDGFHPDSIVIAKGDTITWVNADTRPHWPSSNSHPAHNEYKTSEKGCIGSALDACRGLALGESFTFNFDKTGVFGMHDHLFPGDSLAVKVVSKTSYIFSLQKDNAKIDNVIIPEPLEFRNLDYGEMRTVVRELAKKDPSEAIKYLEKATIQNGEMVVTTHEFAHIIGREIYKQKGFEGIKTCSKAFTYGCYHGVTEQMLLTLGKESLPSIEKECLKLYPPTENQKREGTDCIHGLGHGLLLWNNLDIDATLRYCDTLSASLRSSCWDGVFMEFSTSDMPSFVSEDPWKLCRELSDAHQEKCASYIVQMYLESRTFNAKSFADMCMQAPSPHFARQCIRWTGYLITEFSQGGTDYIVSECKSMGREDLVSICLKGAAHQLAFQRKLNWNTAVVSVCKEVPREQVEECSTYVE